MHWILWKKTNEWSSDYENSVLFVLILLLALKCHKKRYLLQVMRKEVRTFATAFCWMTTETQINILCQAAHKSREMFVVFMKKIQAESCKSGRQEAKHTKPQALSMVVW